MSGATSSKGGLIRRLMQVGSDEVTHESPEAIPVPPEDTVDAASPAKAMPTDPAVTLRLLQVMGPVFRAALLYPGSAAPATQWARAVERMSQTVRAIAQQLARAHQDELDERWSAQTLQPAVAVVVGEYWVHGVLRMGEVHSVEAVPLDANEMAVGLASAITAVTADAVASGERSGLPDELMPGLTLITRYAADYARALHALGIAAAADAFVVSLAHAVMDTVDAAMTRHLTGHVDMPARRAAAAVAAIGFAVAAVEMRVSETLSALRGAGDPAAVVTADGYAHGYPWDLVVDDVRRGIDRLMGTYAYIVHRLDGVAA